MTAGCRLPNLVIAGVAKAGTTSLFEQLARHPDVCAADEKELYYFSASRYGEPLPPVATYARHFQHCGEQRYVMEATPGYFFGGEGTIGALRQVLGEPRVLLSLRDPVTRFMSYYAFRYSQGQIDSTMTPNRYLAECRRRREQGTDSQRDNIAFWGLSGGCYADYIEPWLDTFGDRLLVVFFEDLKADARATIQAVCEWAELSSEPLERADVTAANRTVYFRSAALRRAQLFMRHRGVAVRRRFPQLYSTLAQGYRAVNATTATIPQLDPATREALEDLYADSNRRTARALSAAGYRALPPWLGAA